MATKSFSYPINFITQTTKYRKSGVTRFSYTNKDGITKKYRATNSPKTGMVMYTIIGKAKKRSV